MDINIEGVNSISINNLKAIDKLPTAIYHRSGELLLSEGEELDLTSIAIIKRLGIDAIITCQTPHALREFLFRTNYLPFSVDKLPDGFKLTKPLTDLDGKVLIESGNIISSETKNKLKSGGLTKVYIPKSAAERNAETAMNFRAARTLIEKARNFTFNPAQLIYTSGKNIEELAEATVSEPVPKGEPLKSVIGDFPRVLKRGEEELSTMVNIKEDTLRQLTEFFTLFKNGRDIEDATRISELSKKVIEALIRDKELLLNSVNLFHPRDMDVYLLNHAVNVTTISINIAASLDYSAEQIMELAYCAFLHDIGMFKIPREILNKNGPLDEGELIAVKKHPGYGLDYLRSIRQLPAVAPVVIYQVHEREDRSGYPKNRSGKLIHKYSKIIGIADVYSALISDRPYRKAMSPYKAMRTIVDMGADKKFNVDVIRAFLHFVSLFPIGSYVKLNSGHIGKVIASNPKDFTKPIVRIMFSPPGQNMDLVIDLSKEDKYGIVDGLNWDTRFRADMYGF